MVYALGRPLDITDEETIADIIKQVEAKDYSSRALINAVVTSKPFLEK